MPKLKLLFITSLLLLTLLMLGRGTWSDVTLGTLAQWGSSNYDALLVFPSTYPPRQNLAMLIAANQANFPFQVGRVIGATAVMLQGVMEMADGGRRVQLGILVCAESAGTGCAIGGAVAVSGAIEGVHGAVVVGQGFAGLRESSGQVLTMAAKGGGSGNLPNAGNMTRLSDGEVEILKKAGYDMHEIKRNVYGKKAPIAHYDIYKDNRGNLYTNDRAGKGEWIPLDLNIKDIR